MARSRRQAGTRAASPRAARRLPLAVAAGVVVLIAGLAFQFSGRRLPSGPAPGVRATNLLLITLDTVRADRLGVYGHAAAATPNLDALARAGVRFDDATAQAPITGPSHAAILTGAYPARHGVRDNAAAAVPAGALTLARVLADRGVATGGFVAAFILDRPYGFANGFATFESGFSRVDSGREANAERPATAVIDDAARWLAALPAGRPFFGWVHLYDPHAPYAAPEPFASRFAGSPYDGEIAFVDQEIGRLLAALRARGDAGRTLVAVIADHGESLGGHGEDEHGVFLYEGVLRIPFILSGPGLPGGMVVREQVRAIDLFPTVLDLLQAPHPPVDGVSLVPLLTGGRRQEAPASYAETYYPRLHYGWSELRSLRAGGWKAIDAPRPELYDLARDPHEARNVYPEQQALADRMIAEAAKMDREMAGGGSTAAAGQPDPATLARLRSLGYVGVAAPADPGARGADPKDTIAERREYRTLMSAAIDDLRARRSAAALEKLQRLVQINPRAYDLHLMLGQAYEQQRRLADALGAYDVAALLNPHAASPRLSAAEAHLARGETAAARRRAEEAAQLEPQSFDVALVTGRVLEQEGRTADAIAAYDRAIAVNGANPRARTLLAALATRAGRYDVAETQLRRLLEMGYQPSRTHLGLAQIAERRGRRDEAARHYRDALVLEPALAPAREGLRRVK